MAKTSQVKRDKRRIQLVGKYAEDVGYWKNRVGGGI